MRRHRQFRQKGRVKLKRMAPKPDVIEASISEKTLKKPLLLEGVKCTSELCLGCGCVSKEGFGIFYLISDTLNAVRIKEIHQRCSLRSTRKKFNLASRI